ncbi:M20/M25/M40 family metallo-hydrolase [Natrinema pallidum]|uniref:Acetylornithine deacetylase/succinyl-diaminopimelate desuccinylase n=1 Tax=Natrinema pallidum DSM 3751 TaxID=1227495 RepID=L9YE14_9EURY|nr:acetylornithine deacetylase/succinyl-diaminopimelate desuccinylase [Natrinema pallidum DSM 3751]
MLTVDTSNPPGDTRELVAPLEEYLSEFPVGVERVAVDPAKPTPLVTFPGASDRTLLYTGHLDTVPFDADTWSSDPLGNATTTDSTGAARRKKGAIAAVCFAIRTFAETGTEPPIDLAVAFVSDEEVGIDRIEDRVCLLAGRLADGVPADRLRSPPTPGRHGPTANVEGRGRTPRYGGRSASLLRVRR